MFGEPLLVEGVKVRTGSGQWLGEFVPTLLFRWLERPAWERAGLRQAKTRHDAA